MSAIQIAADHALQCYDRDTATWARDGKPTPEERQESWDARETLWDLCDHNGPIYRLALAQARDRKSNA